jgi:peptidoglycan/xylan/chitin deacetylase (PgdA/CDA1 family)
MASPLRRILRHLRHLRRPPGPVILMYHRVASPSIDPWGLAVAPDRFRDQLQVLARRRKILAMEGFVAALESRSLPRNAVAITFDDGYRDNLTTAAPLLEEAGAPATVFLTASAIGGETLFWWDDLARLILAQPGRIKYELAVGTARVAGDIAAMAPGEAPDRRWRAWDEPRTARQAEYKKLWQLLQRSRPAERAAAMRDLRRAAPAAMADSEDLPLTVEEVARLASSNLSIGSHAMSHQPLTSVSSAERRAEIEDGRAMCIALAHQPVNGFAFPHGDRDAETIAIVREAGFAWACSTRAACIDPRNYDLFDLPRIAAPDVSGRAILDLIEGARP